MIYLDTDRLQQMVGTLESANQRIDEATDILMQITAHDDWGCAERHQINEYILKNKTMIQQLQSTGGGFYNIMKQVAAEFVDTESNIGNLFSGLEGVLGKVLSVAVNSISGTIAATGTIDSAVNWIDSVMDAHQNITAQTHISPDEWHTMQVISTDGTWAVGEIQNIIGQIFEEPCHTGQNPHGVLPVWESEWAHQMEEQGIYVLGLKDFEI